MLTHICTQFITNLACHFVLWADQKLKKKLARATKIPFPTEQCFKLLVLCDYKKKHELKRHFVQQRKNSVSFLFVF